MNKFFIQVYIIPTMVLVWFLITTIIVQYILAKYTAKDAHSRGHNPTDWFVLVLLFGIVAILIYLLSRNDERLPESERPPNKLVPKLTKIKIYGGSALFGMYIIGWLAGPYIADVLFDPLTIYDCETITTPKYGNDDLSDPCVISEERQSSLNQYWRYTVQLSLLFGLLGPPISIYVLRKYKVFKKILR